jgi:hypothetical protein
MSGHQRTEIDLVNKSTAKTGVVSSSAAKFLARSSYILLLGVAGIVSLIWGFFLLWLLHRFAIWLTT